MLTYRVLYIVSIFAGSVIGLEMVWNIADCMNALMAIPNLVSLLCLSGIIVHETRKYLWRDRLDRDMDENEIEDIEFSAELDDLLLGLLDGLVRGCSVLYRQHFSWQNSTSDNPWWLCIWCWLHIDKFCCTW